MLQWYFQYSNIPNRFQENEEESYVLKKDTVFQPCQQLDSNYTLSLDFSTTLLMRILKHWENYEKEIR